MRRDKMRPTTWLAAGVLLALPIAALPANAADGDIPITDPVLLERMGFAPDATNVYATPQAYEQALMSPDERVAVQEARLAERLAAQESAPIGGPYGTADAGYTSLDYVSFAPRILLTDTFGGTVDQTHYSQSGGGLWCFEEGDDVYVAELQGLPHGARLEALDIWYYDNDSEHDFRLVFTRRCYPDFSGGAPVETFLGFFDALGAVPEIRFGSIEDVNEDIDLLSCSYVTVAVLDECAGSDIRIHKARAQWRRQVSPPPATANFGDVPTTHPFFQHIEALAASEITSGCGGGDFCPNGPLTRGQMAVFLAKALGLHWGSI